jgi:hypothetical protein
MVFQWLARTDDGMALPSSGGCKIVEERLVTG